MAPPNRAVQKALMCFMIIDTCMWDNWYIYIIILTNSTVCILVIKISFFREVQDGSQSSTWY